MKDEQIEMTRGTGPRGISQPHEQAPTFARVQSIAFKTPVRQFVGARGVSSMRTADGHSFEWDESRRGFAIRKEGVAGRKFVPMDNVADVDEDAPAALTGGGE